MLVKQPLGEAPSLSGDTNFIDHLNFTFDVFAHDLVEVHIPHRELYNNLKVRKLAFVFYEDYYPLVSFKYQKESKIKAIAIKAYDYNNKEIVIKDLKGVNRLGITFKPDNGHKYCYYHDKGAKFNNKGLTTIEKSNESNSLLCVADLFSEFSTGLTDLENSKDKKGFPIWGYCIIGVVVLLVIGGIVGVIVYVLKKQKPERSYSSDLPNEALINEG